LYLRIKIIKIIRGVLQKKSVQKYCHINTYVAYDMPYEDQSPIYKKSFKFLLGTGATDEKNVTQFFYPKALHLSLLRMF